MATYISDSDFEYFNSVLSGYPALYESRNADLFASDSPSKMAFRILVERLCQDKNNYIPANKLLTELLHCVPNRSPCNLICCPSCRSRKQQQQVKKALDLFKCASNDDTYFLTALMPMTVFLPDANKRIKTLRKELRHYLRAYSKDKSEASFNVLGAFEYDLKTINEYKVSSDRAKELFTDLGYDASIKEAMWLPHLHAIISPITTKQRDEISDIVKSCLFQGKFIKYAVELKSLRSDKDVSDNISELTKYMWKVRLQHSDNIYANKDGIGKSKYKSVFPSEHLSLLVNTTKSNGSFKSLKFDIKT